MNKLLLLYLAALSCYLTGRVLAGPLKPAEIVPLFYDVLTSVQNPSAENERAFFGGEECADVRAALSYSNAHHTETPIWDYLRAHRNIFYTEGAESFNGKLISYSTPFQMGKKGHHEDEGRVLVAFAGKKLPAGGDTGNTIILFTLGSKCYLNIGASAINQQGFLLLEKVINDTRSRPN